MRLDFLHNYPVNQQANALLSKEEFPNISIFLQKNDKKRELLDLFEVANAEYLSFDFWGLRGFFSFLGEKIAYSAGNHQQIFLAAKSLMGYKIMLKKEDCSLDYDALQESIDLGYRIFIIPSINQDVFSLNDYQEVCNFLKSQINDFLLIVDISLSVSLGELPKIFDERVIFLLSGESVGLSRNSGLVLFQKEMQIPFILKQEGVFEAFFEALKMRAKVLPWDRERFFGLCKERLGEKISLFTPIDSGAKNTLALRFDKIKARVLLQDLFIKQIYGANGQECLFGLFQPSFVLQEIGYKQDESRELLSLSCAIMRDKEMQEAVLHLCESYLQITTLGI